MNRVRCMTVAILAAGPCTAISVEAQTNTHVRQVRGVAFCGEFNLPTTSAPINASIARLYRSFQLVSLNTSPTVIHEMTSNNPFPNSTESNPSKLTVTTTMEMSSICVSANAARLPSLDSRHPENA